MKLKPILTAAETASNVIILASVAGSIYNKYSSSGKSGDKKKNRKGG